MITAPKYFLKYLKVLKQEGVEDPDIDLYIGIITHDEGLVKEALQKGANIDTTSSELFDRHIERLVGHDEYRTLLLKLVVSFSIYEKMKQSRLLN